jgi:hypothetical protein
MTNLEKESPKPEPNSHMAEPILDCGRCGIHPFKMFVACFKGNNIRSQILNWFWSIVFFTIWLVSRSYSALFSF